MLYPLHELQRIWADPVADFSGRMADMLRGTALPPVRMAYAGWSLLHRITKRYPPPQLDQPTRIVSTRAFCRLLHVASNPTGPRVLVCAPLSGHHASLLRDTISTLVVDHDVYITDWIDAREVPVEAGPFPLDAYVGYIR